MPKSKFKVIVNVTNTVVYEIEAESDTHAELLIEDNINKYKDKITSESVTDWHVDFVERFEVIDKESHVITKDNMTSTYHSKPKETK